MTIELFLTLLLGFATLSSLITEGIKKVFTGIKNYNILALIVSVIVGGVGTFVYYSLNNISFTTNGVIYLICIGLATGLTSMTSYDKVKQAIEQFLK